MLLLCELHGRSLMTPVKDVAEARAEYLRIRGAGPTLHPPAKLSSGRVMDGERLIATIAYNGKVTPSR